MFATNLYQEDEERKTALVTREEALATRDTLLADGWKPIKPAEVTVRMPGEAGARKITRKQKRKLARQMASIARQNPFDAAARARGEQP